MQQLAPTQLESFMQELSVSQREIAALLRTTIMTEDPQVSERLEDGKWLHGYLKYDSPQGNFVYAIGKKASGAVAFHAMTYYGSQELQEKYGTLLKPFLAGKSCLDFSSPEAIPLSVLEALVHNGSQRVDESVAKHQRR